MTPTETKVGLFATLGFTALALAEVARRAAESAVTARTAGVLLVALSLLFLVRVAGQVLVLVRGPAWLPPMQQWNLVPYRILLPIQLVFLVLMAWIDLDLARSAGIFADRSAPLGWSLIAFSGVYAGSMAVRYAVRMRRRPGERWFGGTIPIVFHVVLAAYLFTLGTYHVSG
jgi:hypothetical protein